MKKILKLTLVLAALFTGAASIYAGDAKARQIMEKNDALKEANTRKSNSVMVVMRGDKKEMKEFSMAAKKYGKETRSKSTFTKPTRLEFLSWSVPGEDTLQWIKLSGGTVRKIASSDKGGSFVGSHFYYEDMAERDIDDFDYKFLGDEKINGEDCYKIEAVKVKGTKVYEKSIAYVRKSDHFVIRAEFYEKQGHTKTMTVDKIEVIDGIITPRKLLMERTDGNGKTIIYLKSIEYNIPVADEALKKENL
jgi:hypothetical protein